MSHITRTNLRITDTSALRSAVNDLKSQGINCDLLENASPRIYAGDHGGECDYVLRLNDAAYDVGFRKQGDGSFAPEADFWDNKIANQLGADVNVCPMPTSHEGRVQHQLGKLMQAYAKAAAVNAAVQQGYSVESSDIDADGNVQVVLAGM